MVKKVPGRISYEFVKSEIEKEGFILHSTGYKNAKEKMLLECKNNHRFLANWDHFKRGHRCRGCSSSFQITIQDVKGLIESEGYILIAATVKTVNDRLDVICPKGHATTLDVGNFKAGKRCRECWIERVRKNAVLRHGAVIDFLPGGVSSDEIAALTIDSFWKSGVYEIVCLETGKRYVGSAAGRRGFIGRWTSHLDELEKNSHHSILLQRAWNKYGKERFRFKILEFAPKGLCIKREQWWIDLYGSYLPENGYNINPLAQSALGSKRTPEQIEVIRLSQTGKVASDATKKKMAASSQRVYAKTLEATAVKIKAAIELAEKQNLLINIVTIVKLSGLSRPTVRKHLTRLGILLRDWRCNVRPRLGIPRQGAYAKMREATAAKIRAAIELAEKQNLLINIVTIAKLSGVDRSKLPKHLERLGISLRDRRRRAHPRNGALDSRGDTLVNRGW